MSTATRHASDFLERIAERIYEATLRRTLRAIERFA
jgi:hypothetical protein